MEKGNIDVFAMTRLQELNESKQNPKSVWYGNSVLVGHNVHARQMTLNGLMQRPTRVNVIMILLCLKGDAIVKCDMQRCHVRPNTLFFCKPGTILSLEEGKVETLSLLVSTEEIAEMVNVSFQKLFPRYKELEKLTLVELTEAQTSRLNDMLRYLSETIGGDKTELYYHECVRSQLSCVSYEILSLFTRSLQGTYPRSHSTRKEAYFRQFVQLLGKHFREERRISFYAKQLNITPKYLGTIVMQQTGKQASAWVSYYVLSEAKALLVNSTMSIQEVAFTLNFPNQSFFGKFFRNQTGMSPGEYRQKNRI